MESTQLDADNSCYIDMTPEQWKEFKTFMDTTLKQDGELETQDGIKEEHVDAQRTVKHLKKLF